MRTMYSWPERRLNALRNACVMALLGLPGLSHAGLFEIAMPLMCVVQNIDTTASQTLLSRMDAQRREMLLDHLAKNPNPMEFCLQQQAPMPQALCDKVVRELGERVLNQDKKSPDEKNPLSEQEWETLFATLRSERFRACVIDRETLRKENPGVTP